MRKRVTLEGFDLGVANQKLLVLGSPILKHTNVPLQPTQIVSEGSDLNHKFRLHFSESASAVLYWLHGCSDSPDLVQPFALGSQPALTARFSIKVLASTNSTTW